LKDFRKKRNSIKRRKQNRYIGGLKMSLENTIQVFYVGNEDFKPETRVRSGLYELLSGGCGGGSPPSFISTPGGLLIISHKSKIEDIEIHDTYKVDRYGNLYKGHTTAKDKDGNRETLNDLDDIDTQK
jgi:hypothetical protein